MSTCKVIGVLAAASLLAGCAVSFYKRSPKDVSKIEALSDELKALEQAKRDLESRLGGAIREKQVSLEMTDRGLVITFVSEVLFDSGKAKLRPEAVPSLQQVADVVKARLGDREIGIEGHTDNEQIKVSGWKSNWELSTARATSVLHYLEEEGVRPDLLSAIGYGEYRPVASNDTPQDRQKNRRVEIVVLPGRITKVRDHAAIEPKLPEAPMEPQPVQTPQGEEQYLK